MAASALAMTPARAANVTVTLGLSAATYAPAAPCALSVAAGANGIAVLDAAVAEGCIVSYETSGPYGELGYLVDCINEVCGDATSGLFLTYWGMYENGSATTYGVSGFRAAAGDELVFAYTTWAPCAAPTGCLP